MRQQIPAVALCLGAWGAAAVLAAWPAHAADGFAQEAMPAGITLQYLGAPQGYGMQRISLYPRNEITYSSDKGRTLYIHDKDEPQKSNCTGECTKTWLPLVPVDGAKPLAGWTIFRRGDGTQQWAHNGKPLYTYVGDKDGGEIMGLGADPELDLKGSVAGNAGRALTAKLPDGWRVEKFQTGGVPTAAFVAPRGFGLREVTDANGVVIVDEQGRVLYAYDGDLEKDGRACGTASAKCAGFVPVEAPRLERPVGDWTIVDRRDGIRQWRYKNRPLYTYEGDRITGDVHGEHVDKRWRLALYAAYWLPSTVKFREDSGRGRHMVTDKGMTLYRRDHKSFNNASVQFAHDIPYRPRVGRLIRELACDARCREVWKPFLAPANAQPRGYWGVHTLPDGGKQWTYKDYALYTFTGDKQPGDMAGDSIYDHRIGDDPNVDNDLGFPALYTAGFFWIFASL